MDALKRKMEIAAVAFFCTVTALISAYSCATTAAANLAQQTAAAPATEYVTLAYMEVQPEAEQEPELLYDVMDPEQNIEAGLYILGRAFQKYDDPDKALMAYNMGDSGMKSAWSKGQHSSKYSRAVIETAQALKRKEH